MLERHLVAEEERLVGRHRLNDRGHQRRLVRDLQRGDELAEIGQARLARDRQQPALDQILLVGRQHQAGAVLKALAQVIVIERRHERTPENRRKIFDAI